MFSDFAFGITVISNIPRRTWIIIRLGSDDLTDINHLRKYSDGAIISLLLPFAFSTMPFHLLHGNININFESKGEIWKW